MKILEILSKDLDNIPIGEFHFFISEMMRLFVHFGKAMEKAFADI